jgi:hypothetical protein
MMPSVVVLVVYAMAVARITTLITHDEITAPVRSWVIRRFDPARRTHRLAVYLLGSPDEDTTGCPWCVSVWVGLGLAPLAWFWSDAPCVMVPVLGFAASQITGMIYGRR